MERLERPSCLDEVEAAAQVEAARVQGRAVPARGDSRDLGPDAALPKNSGVRPEQMRGESPADVAEAHEREAEPT
jgi:hypothetical protein